MNAYSFQQSSKLITVITTVQARPGTFLEKLLLWKSTLPVLLLKRNTDDRSGEIEKRQAGDLQMRRVLCERAVRTSESREAEQTIPSVAL